MATVRAAPPVLVGNAPTHSTFALDPEAPPRHRIRAGGAAAAIDSRSVTLSLFNYYRTVRGGVFYGNV